MTTCVHCPIPVLFTSAGPVHADTHNTQSLTNGLHRATVAPANVIYIDEWVPDPWIHMTDGQKEDHRQRCSDTCDLCRNHRVSCFQCNHDVSYDDEWCGSCGEHWPTSKDPYVKASEQ